MHELDLDIQSSDFLEISQDFGIGRLVLYTFVLLDPTEYLEIVVRQTRMVVRAEECLCEIRSITCVQ